jgi:hypothetical protein
MFLESLGADAALHNVFQSYAARRLVLARVAVSLRDQYRLFTAAGELPAEASGALWHRTPYRAGMPVTGDWVAARIADPDLRKTPSDNSKYRLRFMRVSKYAVPASGAIQAVRSPERKCSGRMLALIRFTPLVAPPCIRPPKPAAAERRPPPA